MIWYVRENEHLKFKNGKTLSEALSFGWGNGYVAVPPAHPAYKMDYDTLMYSIDVHGCLTYSKFGDGVNAPKNWWVFGFDTMHWGDNIENWPKERVIEETMNLFWQLVELEWGEL